MRLMRPKLALASSLLLLAGCRYDGSGTKMSWAPDMADSPAVKPQKGYIDPPPGSVAMNAIFYPKSAEESEQQVMMPEAIAKDPNGEAKGKELFNTFCIPCHGPDAKGGHLNKNIAPPDISGPIYAAKKDGFFFYRITFGTSVMPGYGDAISAFERWYIIRYLRTLQKG